MNILLKINKSHFQTELRNGKCKSYSAFKYIALLFPLAVISFGTLSTHEAYANPQGANVVAGSVTIQEESINKIGITQTTDKAIVDWQIFSIGAAEHTQFYQPSDSSVILNRVVGADPSQILGRLSANGQVFLVNPNGILFGKNAQVDVAGLVASIHNIRNEDFLAGRYNFNMLGKPSAAVINEGTIRIADTGIAAFVAPSVANRGVIVARLGKVELAAANGFTLDFSGDQLITFLVNDSVAQTAFDQQGNQLSSFVENSGSISAQGGYIFLSAKAAENVVHSVINQNGVIEATSVGIQNGTIILNAGTGRLNVTGTLDASAPNGGDGGFIETSGAHVTIAPEAIITSSAPLGKTGIWLIDPVDFTIAATGGDMTGAVLTSALGLNSVVIQSISGGAGASGDISVNDTVSWSANKLTLNAQNNININSNLNGSGTASLALEYGQAALALGNPSDYYVHAAVNLPAGQNFSTKTGSNGVIKNFTVITSLGAAGSVTGTDLQGMNGNLAGNYVLGANIDATGTSGWNAGAGFTPIAPIATASGFSGTFDGLAHTISGLFINRPVTNTRIGFIGGLSGLVQNIGLINGNVSGANPVGGLVGISYGNGIVRNSYFTGSVNSVCCDTGGLVGANSGTIINSYATGSVSSGFNTGGLAGYNSTGTIINSYFSGTGGQGGLVGGNFGGPNIVTNSYWNTQTSGKSTSAGGTGLTSAQMKMQASFVGWDFTDIWTIVEGVSYPTLRTARTGVTLPNPAPTPTSAPTPTTLTSSIVLPAFPLVDNSSTPMLTPGFDFSVTLPTPAELATNVYRMYTTSTGFKKVSEHANYSVLANNAYGDETYVKLPTGYERITQRTDESIGFHALVVIDRNTGIVTISYRGTDNFTNKMQVADMALGYSVTKAEPIFSAAIKYAQEIELEIANNSTNPNSRYFGAKELNFTGHSLGGALATYAGILTGNAAITFNSAPLGNYQQLVISAARPDGVHSPIVNFRSTNDPLTKLDEISLYGSMTVVENAQTEHSMMGLMNSMKIVQDALPVITADGFKDELRF